MTTVRTPGAIITLADETDATGIDLRTRNGREQEVVQQVREYGGFSVFWITDNPLRAQAADRLIDRGEIVPAGRSSYPWCGYQVEL